MRIAAIPLNSVPLEWDRNTRNAWQTIQDCPNSDLVVLPELFASGYTYDRRITEFAESRDGSTVDWLSNAARAFDTHVCGTFVETAEKRIFNTLAIASPSGELAFYRKTSIPPFERQHFSGGRDIPIVETPLGRIGVLVCWDITNKRLTRLLAGKVDLVVIPMAWVDTTKGNIRLPLLGRLAGYPVNIPQQLSSELGVPVVVCNMGGRFKSRIPRTVVTYRAPYVTSTSVILPGSPVRVVTPENNEALLVDLNKETPSTSEQIAPRGTIQVAT